LWPMPLLSFALSAGSARSGLTKIFAILKSVLL
jgi:hypothetical protein